MTRTLLIASAMIACLAPASSACSARDGGPIAFHLNRATGSTVHASFENRVGGGKNSWSTDLPVGALAGLDLLALRSAGDRPVRFAVQRESGRLDCAGRGGQGSASGLCDFQADLGFTAFLTSRGMKPPSAGESFSMMALDVRRDLVDALHASRYPAPAPNDLISMTALGIDRHYIAGLAGVGYRPDSLDTLVQFKALDVTPEFIGGYVRMGYGRLPAGEIVQLKALDIGADYIASFKQAGYHQLSVDQLVQLKALGVTADYARAVRESSATVPTPERLVQLKAIGFNPR